ncbi:carboxymuconolactone decarboxylase family protein [Sphingomonas sp. LB-2]|uniref:carboxymuconolactone decarboxylase family protein n=1 Tax=Sphingomonas caeni TaxID=2984949 RepID=UPI002230EA14|nr:carboxymuconolactone decarboxylase family protein [Sphingomonas caeni]MCW3849101.1 carboxymuconolactone decarboxylase family protein [Sphingomonas caeni]
MTARMNPYAHSGLTQPLIDFATSSAAASGLEHSLLDLVKIRASQINRCAICLHMHSRDARKAGETEMRVTMLSAWQESPLYSARERAALGWTDALTRLADHDVSDQAYAAVEAEFSEAERVALTIAIGTINAFNRLGAGFRLSHTVAAADRKAA